MMPALNGIMLAVSSSLAASIVAKVTVTTALALSGARMARRSRAAVRHALIAAAFGVLLALPVASLLIPPVRIVAPATPQERIVPAAGNAGAISTAATAASAGVVPVDPRPGLSLSALLLSAWIAGMTLFLLPVAIGVWQVRRLRRSALPWRHGQSIVDRLSLDAGIRRRVEVLLHETLPGPVTCGAVHPAILLPENAQTWDAEDLTRAIVHELEHVRRGDWIGLCLARALCAVYWFHPLVWIAWRQLGLEAERSCDDAVLGRSEATAYADQLVKLARRLVMAKSPMLAMANRADLAKRVGAVLDKRQQRGRAGTLPVALACAAAGLLVLTISPLEVVAAQQSVGAEASIKTNAQFRNSTMLVIEDVTVSDRNGKNIEGLSAGDFAVTEDGVAQNINIFEFQKLTGAQDSLTSYYILGYYTRNLTSDGLFRRIDITYKEDAKADLRYRHGYYARKVSPGGAGTGGLEPGGAVPGIGLDVIPPRLTYKVEPAYSEEARKAKYQGAMVLNVEVNASGEVSDVKIVRSLGLGLDEKATEAVKQWKFQPAMKDGKPVAVQVEVETTFQLL